MDGRRNHTKSNKDKYHGYHKKDTSQLIHKTETDSKTDKLMVIKGEREGRDKLGV